MENKYLYRANYNEKRNIVSRKVGYFHYNSGMSKIVAENEHFSIYVKRNGEYWLHTFIHGLGHYIAPLDKEQAAEYIKAIQDEEENTMVIINKDEDCRMWYYILRMAGLENPAAGEIKRALRDYNNKPSPTVRIIKEYDCDGYIYLEEFPAHIKSRDAARKYFRQNMRRICRSHQHDCTEQAFTVWHKIIMRNRKYMVYHRIAFDV